MHVQPLHVLIVEDDWFLAQDAVAAVRDTGCDVVGPFACPVEAENSLVANPAEAALLDVDVGGRTTFALARSLRSAGVPVVFHSDWAAAELPADLADVPLVPKWRGPAAAMRVLLVA